MAVATSSPMSVITDHELSSAVSQVEVCLVTELEDPRFQFADSSGGLMLPTNLTRRGLSEVVNHLLELTESVVFDFLVQLPTPPDADNSEAHSPSRVFLRTSLSKYV